MWLLFAAAHAGCDPGMLERATETVKAAPEAQRVELSAAAFGAVCSDTKIGAHVSQLGSAPPGQRGLLDLAGVNEQPMLWLEVCGGTEGLRVLADFTALPPDAKRRHLWAKCELGRLKWMTEDEFLGAEGLIATPFVAGTLLGNAKLDASATRVLVRGLAGLAP